MPLPRDYYTILLKNPNQIYSAQFTAALLDYTQQTSRRNDFIQDIYLYYVRLRIEDMTRIK